MDELFHQALVTVELPDRPTIEASAPPVDTGVIVLPVPGIQGKQGPPGKVVFNTGGGSSGYLHIQETPATVWVVEHDLGRKVVAVTAYSTDYAVQWDNVGVTPVDEYTSRLTFDDPVAGIALIL